MDYCPSPDDLAKSKTDVGHLLAIFGESKNIRLQRQHNPWYS
jgi:hypothetical protein